jgi:hypothetical protein
MSRPNLLSEAVTVQTPDRKQRRSTLDTRRSQAKANTYTLERGRMSEAKKDSPDGEFASYALKTARDLMSQLYELADALRPFARMYRDGVPYPRYQDCQRAAEVLAKHGFTEAGED